MNESIADFHKLSERLRLTGVLETRTALRIGSGGAAELDGSDLPVLRDALGFPFVPGGSFKGVLRSTIEALVRGAECKTTTGLWTCDPLLEKNGPGGACGWHAEGDRSNVDVEDACAVCRLFGSRMVASHVRMTDMMMAKTERQRERPPIEIRDGVAIDRDLRTAGDGLKCDFEVVSPGVQFDIEIFVENPKDWLMGLLVIGFEQIQNGFTALGGFTSRGLGRVDVRWTEMTRMTARDLFDGTNGTRYSGDSLEKRFKSYRDALAQRAKGQGEG